jgi:hypothetical protein
MLQQVLINLDHCSVLIVLTTGLCCILFVDNSSQGLVFAI